MQKIKDNQVLCQLSLRPKANVSCPLSSAEAPAGYPHQNKIIEKIESAWGTMGRGKRRPLFSLPPSHRAPRALFFFLPSLPTTQRGLCGGLESVVSQILSDRFISCQLTPSRPLYSAFSSSFIGTVCFLCGQNQGSK